MATSTDIIVPRPDDDDLTALPAARSSSTGTPLAGPPASPPASPVPSPVPAPGNSAPPLPGATERKLRPPVVSAMDGVLGVDIPEDASDDEIDVILKKHAEGTPENPAWWDTDALLKIDKQGHRVPEKTRFTNVTGLFYIYVVGDRWSKGDRCTKADALQEYKDLHSLREKDSKKKKKGTKESKDVTFQLHETWRFLIMCYTAYLARREHLLDSFKDQFPAEFEAWETERELLKEEAAKTAKKKSDGAGKKGGSKKRDIDLGGSEEDEEDEEEDEEEEEKSRRHRKHRRRSSKHSRHAEEEEEEEEEEERYPREKKRSRERGEKKRSRSHRHEERAPAEEYDNEHGTYPEDGGEGGGGEFDVPPEDMHLNDDEGGVYVTESDYRGQQLAVATRGHSGRRGGESRLSNREHDPTQFVPVKRGAINGLMGLIQRQADGSKQLAYQLLEIGTDGNADGFEQWRK